MYPLVLCPFVMSCSASIAASLRLSVASSVTSGVWGVRDIVSENGKMVTVSMLNLNYETHHFM